MREAHIEATTRTGIGRALKGSFKGMAVEEWSAAWGQPLCLKQRIESL